jgi:hypothetical protein
LILTGFLLDVGWGSEGSADLYDMPFRLTIGLQLLDALLFSGLLLLGLIQPQSLALVVILHLAVGIPFAHFVDVVGVDNDLPALLGVFSAVTAKQALVEDFEVHGLPLLVLLTALAPAPYLLFLHDLYEQFVTVLDLAALRTLPLPLQAETAL